MRFRNWLRERCARLLRVMPAFRGLGRCVLLLDRLLTDANERASFEVIGPVNDRGSLLLDLRSWEQTFAYYYGEMEGALVAAVDRHYHGGVFYDIGASIGLYSVAFGPICRQRAAYVRAIEPMPANVARLRENLALNRIADATVRIEEMALGRAPGQATLMLCDGSKPGNAKIVGSGGVCVPMSTLDGLWRGCDCEPIGFIKIDTEGWDCEIVSGGREAIAACCPNMLIEFNRERMKNLGFSIAPCWQFLTQELQYRAFRIDHRGRTFPLTTPEEWENVLFLHPSREAEGMCRDSSALLGADGPAGFSRERQGRPS